MSVGWNLNDSIIFLLPNTSFLFFSKMIALHQNVSHRRNTLIMLTWRWRIFAQDIWMGQMRMTDASTTQNFILLAPPVGGLPISQDWLDRMKLVCDHTIPIILPSGKNILGNMVFQISVGYTNLDTRQIQSRLGSQICLFIAPNANMSENMLLLEISSKGFFFLFYYIPVQSYYANTNIKTVQ